MKKPWVWLRVVCGLNLFFALGHTLGSLARPSRGPLEDSLFLMMRNFEFEVMGSHRTHWDFYQGFSLLLSVNLVLLAGWAWQLADQSKKSPSSVRMSVLLLLIGEIVTAALCWRFFFLAPALTSTLAAACLVPVALAASSKSR